MKSKLLIFFLASRPRFLVASVAAVLVGSSLGFAVSGSFCLHLFILALVAITALHSGANMANDYFDHISGNDWVNTNPTPFSGGSRFIQQGVLSAKTILTLSLSAFGAGAVIGIVIVLLTRSIFILALGLVGLLGGFFYTAAPIKLGYRGAGEFVIALLFGLLAVYGSYYLQTERIDTTALLPAVIIAIQMFLVILANEFPDLKADSAVSKKTLVVLFGVPVCIWIYRVMLVAVFITAAAMLGWREMFYAGVFYLFTIPVAVAAMRLVNKEDLTTPGKYGASQATVLLHIAGSIALTAGFVVFGLFGRGRI